MLLATIGVLSDSNNNFSMAKPYLKSTIEYLGVNPDFNCTEFGTIILFVLRDLYNKL